MENKPAAQVDIDELRAQATTPEDHVYLNAEQTRLDEERKATLGGATVDAAKLIELSDGSIATEQEVVASRERGEEPSGTYGNGHGRA
ncbi:hypothetical protein H0V99_00040 [Candidatus Saccharibacteria bacterium]|nr:hypothetical protein [Candidatus Saccharibacteria bacterium]